MRIRIVPLLLTFAFASSLPAAEKSPQDVVKDYCELDAHGARLSSETWKQIAPLIAWNDEPGWDEVTVISGYEITKTAVKRKTATVAVTYHVLGVNGRVFTPKKHDENVVFTLTSGSGGWKITDPTLEPHVTRDTIVRHYRELERDDPRQKKELERAIAAIGADDVEVSREIGCTARKQFDNGSFEEHELKLHLTNDHITAIHYFETMSNGEEGGAYFCELDLEEGSSDTKFARTSHTTRVTELGTERESYVEIESLPDGSYRVSLGNVTLEHCGFGAEFPDSIVIKPKTSKCVVNR